MYTNDGRGNGYDFDAGMSTNALDAYTRGVKPLSKITVDNLKKAGWQNTKTFARFLAKQNFWVSTEWHHSGGEWFNAVEFFTPEYLVDKWNRLTPDEQNKWWKLYKDEKKEPEPVKKQVEGHYTLWGGSRRRPRRMGEQTFTGTLKGNWIYIDGGGRKKASGRYLSYRLLENSG